MTPDHPAGKSKRSVYDQWVLDVFGVDPSSYPPPRVEPASGGADNLAVEGLLAPALFVGDGPAGPPPPATQAAESVVRIARCGAAPAGPAWKEYGLRLVERRHGHAMAEFQVRQVVADGFVVRVVGGGARHRFADCVGAGGA